MTSIWELVSTMPPKGTNVVINIVCYKGNDTVPQQWTASWGLKYLPHQSLNAFPNASHYLSLSSLSSGISSVST